MVDWIRIILLVAVAAGVAHAEEKPFPTKKSTILRKEGITYFVEGRQTIPWGCEISCQKDVRIVGRGAGAVLVVAGSLQIHGVHTREVIIENLTIEPAAKFEDIHLDMVIFRGAGGVRTPEDKACRGGRVFIENVEFKQGSTVDVALETGRVDLSNMNSWDQVRLRGVAAEGKRHSAFTVNIRGCMGTDTTPGFGSGILVSGARDVTFRSSHIGGAKCELVDNLKVMFDANKVSVGQLVIKQTVSGRMSKTKLLKCDIYSTQVALLAPVGKTEKVTIDKCWFKGLSKKKEILATVIHDGADTESGAFAKILKVNKRPLELAGPVDR